MANNKITYQNLNIFKALAAFFVVLLHTQCHGEVFEYSVTLTRTAVSLFFLISGFFLCSSLNLSPVAKISRKKLSRTLQLSFGAYLFYFFWGIFVRMVGTGFLSVKSWFLELFRPFTLVRILIFHEDILAGHLWFLNGLIICYVFAYLFGKKLYSKGCLYIAIFLLAVHVLIGNFIPVLSGTHISMAYYRNGWLYGFPIFILGVHIRKWFDSGRCIKNQILIAGIILSFPLLFLECFIFGYHQLYMSNILMVILGFIWCIQNPVQKKWKGLQKLGSDYFTEIYVFQWAVINIIQKGYAILGFYPNSVIYVIICLIGTILCSIVYKFIYSKLKARFYQLSLKKR